MEQLRLSKIRQRFERSRIEDVGAAIDSELQSLSRVVKPGMRVAVAVGSRGIADLAIIVGRTVDFIKACNASPCIIPAMGSHGGATASGQADVLAGYGITEASMGAPIRSSMEVEELPNSGLENRVFMDRFAYESDGVLLVNRVKPHTDFHGAYESGLMKMCVIGLGKHRQALEIHRYGVRGLRDLVPPTAMRILDSGKILAGIAVVENAYDETLLVRVLSREVIAEVEPELLALAKHHMASLPVADLDILVVDRMGKDISGCGLDTNIIGRLKIRGEEEPDFPRIECIVVSELTPASHGNATGVGLADVITRRLYDAIDIRATYENVRTSSFLERGKIPIVAATDLDAVEAAMRSIGSKAAGDLKLIRIRDTLHLDCFYASEAVCREIAQRSNCSIEESLYPMFASDGRLQDF